MKKVLLIVLLMAGMQLPGYIQAQVPAPATQQNAVKLSELLSTLEKRFKVKFAYSPDVMPLNKLVSIRAKGDKLEPVLDELAKTLGITYVVNGKRVVFAKAEERKAGKVSGQVTSAADGTPLEGVTVSVPGTSRHTVTNPAGQYALALDDGMSELAFSYVGMQTQRTPITGSTVNIALAQDLRELESVVVSGYGLSERRENQIGSATVITSSQLERKPVDRVDRMLEGLVPGLQYGVQSDDTDSPRPRYQTRVRGQASFLASNDPLWIIDGVPIYTGNATNQIIGVNVSISPLSYINPNDIQSVTVLKDAAATSIYGANGANGVILITTKKGIVSKDKITYSFRTGINTVTDAKFQVLTGDEYRELAAEAYANAGLNPADYPFPLNKDHANTDWYDEFFRTGHTMLHDLSFSGGNERTRYFISGAYFKEKKTILANDNERLSVRMNLDQRVHKRLSLSFKMGGSYNTNNLFNPDADYYTNRPNISAFNPDGTFALYDSVTGYRFFNKLAEAAQNDYIQHTFAVNGNVSATLQLFEGLQFNSTNGLDFYNIREDEYQSRKNWSGIDLDGTPKGYARRAQTNYLRWISINRLNYTKAFGQHLIEALAGTEAMDGRRNSLWASGSNFANDDIREVSAAPEETQRAGSSVEEESALSFFGRVNYTFDKRFSAQVNFRRDGNSRFGKDVAWGNFGSVGAAWTVSNEAWWRSGVIDFAKLKASYGTNGNSRVGNYASKGLYTFDEQYSYNGQPGAVMITGANPTFSWEISRMLSTGVNLSLWKRISVELEGYRNTTSRLIDNVDVSRTTGETKIFQNMGRVRNTGVELTVISTNVANKNFHWVTNFNITHNRNRIISLYNNNDKVLGTETIRRVGEDANTLYLVRWAGVDPRDGAPMWYDLRGNITKVFDLDNRVAIGSTNPDFFGGITNNFTYRQFTLSALLYYSVGGHGFSGLRRNSESDGLYILDKNQSRNQLDRWQEEGDLALTPRLLYGISTSSSRTSTRFVHKKTNLRLQNVSLNYRLPDKTAGKLHLQNFSAYLQADNVGFWTPYQSRKDRNTYKNSFSPYPMERVISFGLVAGI
ncbi:SusC/RagA family TonB-linked outer membrane protein [Chitinophaga horti]|uniref:SusC/RagA family TonB-linked outer membrane protein n=1 Tax=Chitinophaga horti TaxID=2920382 RepID=A0ABY6J3X0_9BACT|nr:SusC/RagA family TonB-linked outer membrane protein [Chitinophaga horti]UYQ94369.1 SusC/RagA family TonB-linked outer membrane protein [Chitinophaga horti]